MKTYLVYLGVCDGVEKTLLSQRIFLSLQIGDGMFFFNETGKYLFSCGVSVDSLSEGEQRSLKSSPESETFLSKLESCSELS